MTPHDIASTRHRKSRQARKCALWSTGLRLRSEAHLHQAAAVHQGRQCGDEGDMLRRIPLGSAELAVVLDEALHLFQGVHALSPGIVPLELVHQVLDCRAYIPKVVVHVLAVEFILSGRQHQLVEVLLDLQISSVSNTRLRSARVHICEGQAVREVGALGHIGD